MLNLSYSTEIGELHMASLGVKSEDGAAQHAASLGLIAKQQSTTR